MQLAVRVLSGVETAELQVAQTRVEFPVGSEQRVRKDIRGTLVVQEMKPEDVLVIEKGRRKADWKC